MSKWNKNYFTDLAERVGSTFIYGLATLLTTVSVTDINSQVGWTIVVLPTTLSLLKGLLANLSTGNSYAPTASAVAVSSNPE